MNIKDIVELLENERFKRCMNQVEFPKLLDLSRFTYVKIANGYVCPKFKTLAKMVKFLNENGHAITLSQIEQTIVN